MQAVARGSEQCCTWATEDEVLAKLRNDIFCELSSSTLGMLARELDDFLFGNHGWRRRRSLQA